MVKTIEFTIREAALVHFMAKELKPLVKPEIANDPMPYDKEFMEDLDSIIEKTREAAENK